MNKLFYIINIVMTSLYLQGMELAELPINQLRNTCQLEIANLSKELKKIQVKALPVLLSQLNLYIEAECNIRKKTNSELSLPDVLDKIHTLCFAHCEKESVWGKTAASIQSYSDFIDHNQTELALLQDWKDESKQLREQQINSISGLKSALFNAKYGKHANLAHQQY